MKYKVIFTLALLAVMSLVVNEKKGAAVAEKTINLRNVEGVMCFSTNNRLCFYKAIRNELIPTVQRLKKNKAVKTKDPFSKACDNAYGKVKTSELYKLKTIGFIDSDKAGYIFSSKKILKYNKNGKIKKVINLKKKYSKMAKISYLESCGKNKLLCFLDTKETEANSYEKNYLVINTKSGKIKKHEIKDYHNACGLYPLVNNKKYIFFCDTNLMNIYRVKISTGNTDRKLECGQLIYGNNWKNMTDEDCSSALTCEAFACDEKNIYIKSYQGLYKWNGAKVKELMPKSRMQSNDVSGIMLYRNKRLYYLADCEKCTRLFIYSGM